MATAMFIFSCVDGLSKYVMDTYSVVQVLWFRYLFLVVLSVTIAARRGGLAMMRTQRPWLQVVRSVLLVVQVGLFVYGFKHLQMAHVNSIGAAAPLLVTALSLPILGERVGIRRWIAVGIGFAGVLLVHRPGLGVVHPVSFWVLLGTLLFAVFQIMTRVLARTDSSETTLAYSSVIGAALLTLVVTSYWGQVWTTPDVSGWTLLTLVAVLGGVGHFLLIISLQSAPPVVLQPFFYTILVWSTIVGFVVFGDIPDSPTVIGALLIVSSGLYTQFRERRLQE